MEIVLELENSDLVIEFDSNILYENYSDRTSIRWNFSNGTHSATMAGVFDSISEDTNTSECLPAPLRLCSRCYEK